MVGTECEGTTHLKLWDTLIIGAGQSGLAAGYYLQQANVDFLLLDANEQIGGSWQNYWHSLKLFSPAKYSQLPGMAFPGDPMRYPSRDEVIDYLQTYADHFSMPVVTNTRVETIQKHDDCFEIMTGSGEVYYGRTVISAAGAFNRPHVPEIYGQDGFMGCIRHAFHYRAPEPFRGQRIVVVGANNSAVQIGVELAEVADVTLATRRPIEWWPKRFLGRNIFDWFHGTGFDVLPLGLFFDLDDSDMVLDDGTYRDAVESGRPSTRQMFTAFTEDGVIWSDGEREQIDTVLFATGYRPGNIPYLETLGALCPHTGQPLNRGGVSTEVDGLYYMGVFGQRAAASATLRGVGRDAKYVVNHLTRHLNHAKQKAG